MSAPEIPIWLASGSLVFFSPAAVQHIPAGYNFFDSHFRNAAQVAGFINVGTIGAVDMGDSGSFWIEPMPRSRASDALLAREQYYFQMGLAVLGGGVFFRDLYELYDWKPELQNTPTLALPDGFYDITFATTIPSDLAIGAEQKILFTFEPVESLPAYHWTGIPRLYE